MPPCAFTSEVKFGQKLSPLSGRPFRDEPTHRCDIVALFGRIRGSDLGIVM
jgi:hypothetical protein